MGIQPGNGKWNRLLVFSYLSYAKIRLTLDFSTFFLQEWIKFEPINGLITSFRDHSFV